MQRLARALGRLPHRYQVEQEMVRAAEVVGLRLMALLVPARQAGARGASGTGWSGARPRELQHGRNAA